MSYIQILIPWHDLPSKWSRALTKFLGARKVFEQFPTWTSNPAPWPLQGRHRATGRGNERFYKPPWRRWRAVTKNSAVKESELWSHTKPERGRCSKIIQSNHQPYGVRTEWQRLFTWNNLVILLHTGRKSGLSFKTLENLTHHYNTLHSGCSSWCWGSCRKLKLIWCFLLKKLG